ncbi:MAG: alpha/beta hydrolase [Ktedonobacteraceae bacterium]
METQKLSLVHLVHQPSSTNGAPPLLLLLHGVGSNEHDLFELAPALDKRFLIISVRAPITLAPGNYAWFEVDFRPGAPPLIDPAEAEASRKALLRFINEAVTAYGADPSQVYLMGFSQGAIMSASIMLTQPKLIAGAVLMSGRVLPEVLPLRAPTEELEGFPVLLVHGRSDAVLPIHYAHESRQLLLQLPVKLDYHEYAMGHEVSLQSLADVSQWLSKQLDNKKSK